MKNTSTAFAAMAATFLVAATTAHAADIGCVSESSPANLPPLMLDGFIPSSTAQSVSTGDFETLLEQAVTQCLEREQEAYVQAYVEASSTSLLLREMERRLLDTGFPLVPMYELSEAYNSNPNLDVQQYLLDRPDDFFNAAHEAAQNSSVTVEDILVWVVFYAEMNRVFRAANTKLAEISD